MSTEKKTITINPDLFKINGKTKKSKPKKSESEQSEKPQIKMKSLTPAKNNTLKREILKVIRAKQQDEYKRLFSKPANESKSKIKENFQQEFNKEFNKEFDNSLQYFSDLEKKVNQESHNQTFKKMPSTIIEPVVFNELPSEFNLPMPTEKYSPSVNSGNMQVPRYVCPPHPGYGCLKNGTMPTYRTIKNKNGIMNIPVYQPPLQIQSPQFQQPRIQQSQVQTNFSKVFDSMPTEKSYSAPQFTRPVFNASPSPSPSPNPSPSPSLSMSPPYSLESSSEPIDKNMIMKEKLKKQYLDKMSQDDSNMKKIKNMKRRKIYKRTYHVGKSKTAPKIGCLISNKTIRQKIQQSVYDLKHTNMKDVRKFLLKRGFIKVGTTAPNDVLRKMYETVATVCGEVNNHNPDNLLYNFVNENEDK